MVDALGVTTAPASTVDVLAIEAELGVNFESGRGPDMISNLFVSPAPALTLILLAIDLTEFALDPTPKLKLCSLSLCEGVMLLFIVFLLSTLARKDTESASASTLLRVAFAAAPPTPREPVPRGGEMLVGRAFWEVTGEMGLMRSSTATSISIRTTGF